MNQPLLYIKHKLKLAMAALVQFVIARPALFSLALRIVNRLPRLKWFLWRVRSSSMNLGEQQSVQRLPGHIPPAARGLYQQLTLPRERHE